MDEIDIEHIWDIADKEYEKIKDEEVCKNIECDKDELCKHEIILTDHITSDIICSSCGQVVRKQLSQGVDWGYSETGNNQRADLSKDKNPYSTTGAICGMVKGKNNLVSRLYYQQSFSHKQRTFWTVSQLYDTICSEKGLSIDVCETARNIWHIYMESGILTRGGIRRGLIAACFLYSAIYNNRPLSRENIIEYFKIDKKILSKGEKIFNSIINENEDYMNLNKNQINIDENQSFIKYCNLLSMSWELTMECVDVFKCLKEDLVAVSPQSSIGGIIAYVVKNRHKLKNPTKTIISKSLSVCMPTINKVISIILSCDHKIGEIK